MASSCELRPCRKSNTQYTPVFSLLQPLPGDFRSNDVTSGSLPVTWGHKTLFSVTWQPPPASYSLVRGQMHSIRQFSAFYSHFQLTSGEMTSLPGTLPVPWGHMTSFSVTWLPPPTSYILVGSRTQYMPVFALLQPLPGDLRSNDVTSGSLPVTWGHITSFPVTSLAPPASYSLVKSQTHSIHRFLAFYIHFQLTSRQMTSLPGHFRLLEVMWLFVTQRPPPGSYGLVGSQTHSIPSFRPSTATSRWLPVKWRHFWFTSGHLRSRDVISCDVTASFCELQPWIKSNTVYASFRLSTATSRWLPIKWRHFRVTSDNLKLRDVISYHVTASCELQPCRKSYAQYTPVFSLLQALPGDFQSNDVSSGLLLATWSLVMSFPVTWLPPPASYSIVGSRKPSICQFSVFYSHFQVTSGHRTSLPVTSGHLRSCYVIFCHLTASSCEQQPCRKLNTQNPLVFGLLQPLLGDIRSNDITSGSLPVTWGHVMSFSVSWLPPPARYSLVGSQTHSIR